MTIIIIAIIKTIVITWIHPWPQNAGLTFGGMEGGIAISYGQMKCSLALVGNHLEIKILIKTLVVV